MTKKEFLKKYNITHQNLYYYEKNYSQFIQNGKFNYKSLDIEIQDRNNIKLYCQELIQDKTHMDLYQFVKSKDKWIGAERLINGIYANKQTLIVRENFYNRLLEIVAEFGEKYTEN